MAKDTFVSHAQADKESIVSKQSSTLSNNAIFDKFFEDQSYEFNLWLKSLIDNNNNDWADDYDEDFIDWYDLVIGGKHVPLIQQRRRECNDSMRFNYDKKSEYQYRINPIYFDSFCDYFNENIRPQL